MHEWYSSVRRSARHSVVWATVAALDIAGIIPRSRQAYALPDTVRSLLLLMLLRRTGPHSTGSTRGKQVRAAVLSKNDAQTGVFSPGCNVIPLVMLQADPVPESPVPVAVMQSDAKLLTGNQIMKVMNVISFL
jgi:hypothetical protein